MMRHVHALLRVLRPRLLAVVALSAGTLAGLAAEQDAAVASGLAGAAAEPAGSAQNCSSAPAGNAFYVPPNPLPPGQHGDIIWCRPVASPTPGAKAWQILYLSTTVSGARTAVSGTVLVPTAPYPGTRPVTAYASGTQGWGDQCAPSREMASGSYDDQFPVDNLLSPAWPLAVTPYPPLRTPPTET